jgi:hypothetical protein
VRGKETRARLVDRFKDGVYVFPDAVFALTEEEVAASQAANQGCAVEDPDEAGAPGSADEGNDATDGRAADDLPDARNPDDDAEAETPPVRSRRRARSTPAAFANAAE